MLTGNAVKFVEKERSGPFLPYLSHKALHPNMMQANDGSVTSIGEGGLVAADRHKGMYGDKIFPRRPNEFVPPLDKPALARKIGDLPPLGRRPELRKALSATGRRCSWPWMIAWD